ncbi:hypothetical protein JTB14_015494 [Gonioctena quinquepunctata]|nr:hypothetical protein JTB14_015494 [Gonioctena quinquepunctata]
MIDDVGSDSEIDGEETENFDILNLVLEKLSLPERTPLESDSDSEDNIPLSHSQKAFWKKDVFQSKTDPMDVSIVNNSEILSSWQYYLQKTGKVTNIPSEDIKKLFGLHATMGATNLPTMHMYWNANYKFLLISNVMPPDKFYLLRVKIHVVDNLSVDETRKTSGKYNL